MSEVIEEFIRKHPGATENEAFEGFAAQERIRAWLGADATRRERLRREFARVWMQMEAKSTSGGASAVVQRPVAVQVPEPPKPQPPPSPSSPSSSPPSSQPVRVNAVPGAPARHLKVLCADCERVEVWAEGSRVRCRHCGREYDNMLDLVPVKHVGMFHYVFGEGAAGWLAAGGIAILLVLLYLAATRL